MCDVQDMIEKKLTDIFGGENQTELVHAVNIEENVAVECKIKQEEDSNEEIASPNNIFNSNNDYNGEFIENIVNTFSIEETNFSIDDKFSYIKEEPHFVSSDLMGKSDRNNRQSNKLSNHQNKPKKLKLTVPY